MVVMKDNIIRFWGLADILFIIWNFYLSIIKNQIPFYSNFLDSVNSSLAFENYYVTVLTVFSQTLVLTVLVSGILMLRLQKIGVYISIFQFPFRVFFVLTPTLFFLPAVSNYLLVPNALLIVVLVCSEIIKLLTQISFLKHQKRNQ